MASPAPIRFALIGHGHIGKRHVERIRQHPDTVLVAGADIRTAKDCGWQEGAFFPSLNDLLTQGPDFEVLVVATPNGWHETHGLAGLKAGKHVVIEKPLTLTQAGADRILKEARARQKQVFCVMQNRYSPPSQWIKGLLEADALGKILLAQVNCFWNRDDRYYQPRHWHGTLALDGGPLFTQFSHFIDTLYWLLGDMEPIQAHFQNFQHRHSTEFEDSGLVHFELEKGGIATLNYTTAVWAENLESSLTLIGEKGAVKIGGQYMDQVQVCKVENYHLPELSPTLPANDYGTYKGSAANHHHIYQNVVSVLRGREQVDIPARDGRKVVEIIEKIYAFRPDHLLHSR